MCYTPAPLSARKDIAASGGKPRREAQPSTGCGTHRRGEVGPRSGFVRKLGGQWPDAPQANFRVQGSPETAAAP